MTMGVMGRRFVWLFGGLYGSRVAGGIVRDDVGMLCLWRGSRCLSCCDLGCSCLLMGPVWSSNPDTCKILRSADSHCTILRSWMVCVGDLGVYGWSRIGGGMSSLMGVHPC